MSERAGLGQRGGQPFTLYEYEPGKFTATKLDPHVQRCQQDTVRGDRCQRKTKFFARERDGSYEAYCTFHANYYGIREHRKFYEVGWSR